MNGHSPVRMKMGQAATLSFRTERSAVRNLLAPQGKPKILRCAQNDTKGGLCSSERSEFRANSLGNPRANFALRLAGVIWDRRIAEKQPHRRSRPLPIHHH